MTTNTLLEFEPIKNFPNGYPVPFMIQQREVEDYLAASLEDAVNIERVILWNQERPTRVRCTRSSVIHGEFEFEEFEVESGESRGRLRRTVAQQQANEARLSAAYGVTPEQFPSVEMFELYVRQARERRPK